MQEGRLRDDATLLMFEWRPHREAAQAAQAAPVSASHGVPAGAQPGVHGVLVRGVIRTGPAT